MAVISAIGKVVLVAIVSGLLPATSSLEVTELVSKIEEVTVIGGTAQVLRHVSTDNIKQGYHTLLVKGLSANLDVSSFNVKGVGNAQVISTETRSKSIDREENADVTKVTRSLLAMKEKLKADAHTLRNTKDMGYKRLDSLALYVQSAFMLEREPTSTLHRSAADVAEILDFQEREVRNVNQKLSTTDEQLNCTYDAIAILTETEQELNATGVYNSPNEALLPLLQRLSPEFFSEVQIHNHLANLPTNSQYWPEATQEKELLLYVYVPNSAKTAQKLSFNITYLIPNHAEWQAEYDVRLLRTTKKAPTSTNADTALSTTGDAPVYNQYTLYIDFYGSVAQRTGESWEQIRLHLSTAQNRQLISSVPVRRTISLNEKSTKGSFSMSSVPKAQSVRMRNKVAAQANTEEGEDIYDDDDNYWTFEDGIFLDQTNGLSKSSKVEVSVSADAKFVEPPPLAGTGQIDAISGSLGMAYVFSPAHLVNVTDNDDEYVRSGLQPRLNQKNSYSNNNVNRKMRTQTSRTRLFISETSVEKTSIFSYIVPTRDSTAYLKAWGEYSGTTTDVLKNAPVDESSVNAGVVAPTLADAKSSNSGNASPTIPLLGGHNSKVYITGDYVGRTDVAKTQPGGYLRLNLGADNNIVVESIQVIPPQSQKKKDKSSWFVTDKIKYKVKTTEYFFTLHNTHSAPHLVIMSEYTPQVRQDSIKVEMQQPAPEKIIYLKNDAKDDVFGEEEFVKKVIEHPLLTQHPMHPLYDPEATKPSVGNLNEQYVFAAKGSNNLVWAQWMEPKQVVTCSYKFKLVYPAGKQLVLN